MTPAFALRPATPADDELLRQLYASTRAGELAAAGLPQPQIETLLEMQWDAQRRYYADRFPDSAHDIVLVDGQRIGRIWVDRSPAEIHLLDLALLPEHQGRGIGTALVLGLQDEATRGDRPLRLSVAKENAGALALYRRLGFGIVGDIATHHLMEWRHRAGAG